jgi:hypothetical protein
VANEQGGVIFAGNHGVDAARERGDRSDVAEEHARSVQRVDQRLEDQKARHVPEVRLLRVRFGTGAIAPAHAEPISQRTPDEALADAIVRLAVPRLPPPVLVNDEADAGGRGRFDHGHRLRPIRRHRFLADHVHAALRCQTHQYQMGLRTGGDVHEIQRLALQKLFGGPVRTRRKFLRAGQLAIACGHDLHFRNALPGFRLDSAEEAAADQGAAQRFSLHGLLL